jgi:hypothetical protein
VVEQLLGFTARFDGGDYMSIRALDAPAHPYDVHVAVVQHVPNVVRQTFHDRDAHILNTPSVFHHATEL